MCVLIYTVSDWTPLYISWQTFSFRHQFDFLGGFCSAALKLLRASNIVMLIDSHHCMQAPRNVSSSSFNCIYWQATIIIFTFGIDLFICLKLNLTFGIRLTTATESNHTFILIAQFCSIVYSMFWFDLWVHTLIWRLSRCSLTRLVCPLGSVLPWFDHLVKQ